MRINQSEEEVRYSYIVNVNVEIRAIRLTQAQMWSVSPEEFASESDAVGNIETQISFDCSNKRRLGRELIFGIDFNFRAMDSSSKQKDLIKIDCTFEATYIHSAEFEPTEEQLRAFHTGNVVLNCWPYFREFVQNGSVRMHLPSPPIDFLRIMPRAKASRKELPSED